jgi:hypothetical protein
VLLYIYYCFCIQGINRFAVAVVIISLVTLFTIVQPADLSHIVMGPAKRSFATSNEDQLMFVRNKRNAAAPSCVPNPDDYTCANYCIHDYFCLYGGQCQISDQGSKVCLCMGCMNGAGNQVVDFP